jgi:molybdopterin molybdotransferase
MINAQEATELILNISHPIAATEQVPLFTAVGRILATPIISQLEFPHWDNSAMDGYAVQWSDIANGREQLTIVSEIPAGVAPTRAINSGEAARIFTGAMLPEGADTIIMQEHVQRSANSIQIIKPPKLQGDFVRRRGAFAQPGNELLSAGTRLTPAAIAVLAAARHSQATVYCRPRVAILSTGDELVAPEQPLQPGQIVDSNQYALAALIQQWGGEAVCLGIIPDRPDELTAAIQQALNIADIVLSTGGVSVGEYDYVDRVLAKLGGEIHLTAVAVKPGKPLTVASFQQPSKSVLYFGLPGNPVSALVSCWRFIYLSFQQVAGIQHPSLSWSKAITTRDLKSDGQRESYLWGRVTIANSQPEFTPVVGGHNSGNLINLAQANTLALLPIGTFQVSVGDVISVLHLS